MNSKRILVILLIVVTVLSGIGAIYVGIRLSQQETVPAPAQVTPTPGACSFRDDAANCYCTQDTKCCNGAPPYETCGARDRCVPGATCEFRNIGNTFCPVGQMTFCNFTDNPASGVVCMAPPSDDSCLCRCDINDAPYHDPSQWSLVYNGPHEENCNGYTETAKYLSNCSTCNNHFFCIACWERITITTPPVTTPVITTPIITTPIITTPIITTPLITTPIVTTLTPTVTTTLPVNALITDEVDRILLGLVSIFIGILLFKSGMHYEFIKLLKFAPVYINNVNKQNFEKNILKNNREK